MCQIQIGCNQNITVSNGTSFFNFAKMFYNLFLRRSARGFMHMKIVPTSEGRFILGQFSNPFSSIPEMIQHYSVNKLPIKGAEHMSLLYPVIDQLLWHHNSLFHPTTTLICWQNDIIFVTKVWLTTFLLLLLWWDHVSKTKPLLSEGIDMVIIFTSTVVCADH